LTESGILTRRDTCRSCLHRISSTALPARAVVPHQSRAYDRERYGPRARCDMSGASAARFVGRTARRFRRAGSKHLRRWLPLVRTETRNSAHFPPDDGSCPPTCWVRTLSRRRQRASISGAASHSMSMARGCDTATTTDFAAVALRIETAEFDDRVPHVETLVLRDPEVVITRSPCGRKTWVREIGQRLPSETFARRAASHTQYTGGIATGSAGA
jgi:hypothetical protein